LSAGGCYHRPKLIFRHTGGADAEFLVWSSCEWMMLA
jgi:hypothetical protein